MSTRISCPFNRVRNVPVQCRQSILTFILLAVFIHPAVGNEPLRTIILDVGEGQAVLFQQGEAGVLVDTGPLNKARHVLDRLAANGVENLEYLFLTHLHDDHASGYFRIREAFPDMQVIDSGHAIPKGYEPGTARRVYRALEQDPLRHTTRAGETIKWRKALIHVLWPIAPEGRNLNRHSLVLALDHGALSALVMGDADMQVEQRLMERGTLPEQVALLVAGHHGSARTAGRGFLETVRPRISVISINADNARGYPDPGIVERLERYSGKLLKTYRDGEICVEWTREATDPWRCATVD